MTFDLQRSSEVLNISAIREHIRNFLSDFYWHLTLSISFRFLDIRLQSSWGLTSTFDIWKSPEVKNISTIRKPIHDFLFIFYWHFLSISYRFRDIRLQSFKGLTLNFDLQRSSEIKNIPVIWNPIHDFLSNFYWHFLSISYRCWDIFGRSQRFWGLTLTLDL